MNVDADKMTSSAFVERLKMAIGHESARSFALRIGLSPTAVAQYLSGKSEPTRPSIIALAKGADVSVEWLATGRDQIRPSPPLPILSDISPPPIPMVADPQLMGRLTDGIFAVYKDMSQAITPMHLGQKAAEMMNEILAASDGPEDYAGMVKLRLAQLRQQLGANHGHQRG